MEYILMHKNIPVVELELDDDTCYVLKVGELFAPEHIPVGVGRAGEQIRRDELNKWWQSRSIPASRSGLREALELLNISSPKALLTKCFGLSLSDQYWVKPKNSDIAWSKVNFFENPFSEDVGTALFGKVPTSENISLNSPDNTSDGWLKKKWIIRNGERYLMKAGSPPIYQEPLNEMLACEIMRRLNIPHAEVELIWEDDQPYSLSKDFITTETELVSADYIKEMLKKPNDTSPYELFLNCCEALGIPNARESIEEMLLVDYITANTDRHYGNFGAVRNAETLEWLGMSLIYDCGTSMWNDTLASFIKFNTSESKPFRSTHENQIKFVSLARFDLSELADISDYYGEILEQSPYIDGQRKSVLCLGLKARVDFATELIEQQQMGFDLKM